MDQLLWRHEEKGKTEIWSIGEEGYCWFETYGPSMTEIASLYRWDDLLNPKNYDKFNKILPPEINTFKELMRITAKNYKINCKDDMSNLEIKINKYIEDLEQ